MEAMIILVLLVVVFFMLAASKNKKNELKETMKNYNFNADYVTRNKTLFLDSKTKCLLVLSNKTKKYKYIVPELVSSWRTYNRSVNHSSTRTTSNFCYLEIAIKDLDEPSLEIFFGGNRRERDEWFNRLSAVYNS